MRQSDGDSKLSPAEARLLLQKIAAAEAAAKKNEFYWSRKTPWWPYRRN